MSEIEKNQNKSVIPGRNGGYRPGSGRKPGKALSRLEIIEALGKDTEYFKNKLQKWLDSEDVRLQTFAWEQIFGKAVQSTELSGSVTVNQITKVLNELNGRTKSLPGTEEETIE